MYLYIVITASYKLKRIWR